MVDFNFDEKFPFSDPNFPNFQKFFRNQKTFYKNFEEGLYHEEEHNGEKQRDTDMPMGKNMRFSREK